MAIPFSNSKAFLDSLSDELDSQANRVRNLIGDRHWLSDGHHKEHLTRCLLQRHMPDSVQISRGFVVDPTAHASCTSEQDILIIDRSQHAPIFDQGDLAIIFPSLVLGAVSVKTTYSRDTLKKVTLDLLKEPTLYKVPARVWLGGFFFEGPPITAERLVADIRASLEAALGALTMAKCDGLEFSVRVSKSAFARILFRSEKIVFDAFTPCSSATSVFVARLLDHIAAIKGGGRSEFADFVDDVCGDVADRAHGQIETTRSDKRT